MLTLLIHINNADPFKLDVEEMPQPSDQMVIGKNPRDRADRELNWIEDGVSTIAIPMWRIVFFELLPSNEAADEFPLPFRSD